MRQPRTEGHRLKGREDGVAAEQGEEPGQAGGRQHERLVLVLHLNSQRDQVASGPAHDLAQQVRVRREPGQVVEPGVDRVVRLRAEDVAEAGMARLELARSELQWYVQLAGPGATRGQVDRPRQAVVVDPRRRGRGLERRLGGEALVGVAERETGPVGGRSPHDLLRSITDPVLHLEQVGEVVVDRKAELDPDWLAEVALELEPLVEPVTHEAQPAQADAVRLEALEPWVGQDELGRVVVDDPGAQDQERRAVDRQRPAAQEPRIGVDKSADRAPWNVADRVGVHERPTFEHGDRIGSELGRQRPLRSRDAPVDAHARHRVGRRRSLVDDHGFLAHDRALLDLGARGVRFLGGPSGSSTMDRV